MLARNVLIFHGGALGDFVLSWPLVLSLARLLPQSRIFYVVPAQKGALAERVLRVEWADSEAGWHALFAERPSLAPPADKLIRGAHTIVSFAARAPSMWAKNVSVLAPEARLSFIEPNPPADFSGHVLDHLIEQWRDWPAAYATAQQIRRGIAERGLAGIPLSPEAIVLHPGSGSESKNWPIERFLELAERLQQKGRTVRFLLGEVELERWPAELIARLEAAGDVRRPVSYLDLLNEISRAQAVIGNDSGPAHLAGLLGVPTIALFGPTSPQRWKPLGPKVQAIAGPLDNIAVADVLDRM